MVVPQGLVLRWVVVYVVAAGVGGVLTGVAGRLVPPLQADFASFQLASKVVGVTAGLLSAALLGYVQWRLLREVVLNLGAGGWIGAIVGAWLFSRVLSEVVQSTMRTALPLSSLLVPLLLVNALVSAVLQFWVLRPHVEDALGWAFAFVAGSLTGAAVVTFLGPALIAVLQPDRTQVPGLPAFVALVFLIPALAAIPPAIATGWAIPRLAPR